MLTAECRKKRPCGAFFAFYLHIPKICSTFAAKFFITTEMNTPNLLYKYKKGPVITFVLFALMLLLSGCRSNDETETLLCELDQCIGDRADYCLVREHQADSLCALLNDSVFHYERFEIYGRLVETYRSYNLDSQLYYTEQRLDMAQTPFERQVSLLNYSEVLMRSGMYHESMLYMDSALFVPLDPVLEPYFSHLRRTLFGLMEDFAVTRREQQTYSAITQQYRKEMMAVHPSGSFLHELVRADYLYEEQLYDSALQVMETYERSNDVEGQYEEPVFAFTRAQIHRAMGNNEQAKHYLAIASIADLKNAIREYIALRELAVLLYEEGDVERAYTYMDCAAQDAMAGSERVRSIETSTSFPVVEGAYLRQLQRHHFMIMCLFASVLVLLGMVIMFLFYVNLKRHQLAILNDRLAQSNEDLRRSNRIKSVYVKRFMKMTNIQDFDDAFLELFPDFVKQVQSLLVPEADLRIKPKERLNTDLRVLALIYLGITDSKQIADILRYSLPTIYNSRTRMRNLAKEDREHFEEKVAAL